jgi:hypothetical protein
VLERFAFLQADALVAEQGLKLVAREDSHKSSSTERKNIVAPASP